MDSLYFKIIRSNKIDKFFSQTAKTDVFSRFMNCLNSENLQTFDNTYYGYVQEPKL